MTENWRVERKGKIVYGEPKLISERVLTKRVSFREGDGVLERAPGVKIAGEFIEVAENNFVLSIAYDSGAQVGKYKSGGMYDFSIKSPESVDVAFLLDFPDDELLKYLLQEIREYLRENNSPPVCWPRKHAFSCTMSPYRLAKENGVGLINALFELLKHEMESWFKYTVYSYANP
jgi:hypothetical protein